MFRERRKCPCGVGPTWEFAPAADEDVKWGARLDDERSIRRGEGDPGLAEALRRDAEGDWD